MIAVEIIDILSAIFWYIEDMNLIDNSIIKFAIKLFDRFFYASDNYTQIQTSLVNLYNEYASRRSSPIPQKTLLHYLQQVPIDTDSIIRVGSDIEGGYVMLKPLDAGIAISVGVGSNVSWDSDLSKLGFQIFMFDHTVKKSPIMISNSKFFRIGITGNENSESKKTLNLIEILDLLNLRDKDRLILKIDTEGAEWEVLRTVGIETLNKFDQILIEFHRLDLMKNNLHVFEKLTTNHSIIHVNPNNYSIFFLDQNFLIPNTLEVTFVKNSLLKDLHLKDFSKITYRNFNKVPAVSNQIFRLNEHLTR